MRILVHDYAGHPFQAELSRALAGRGHDVVHAYFAEDIGPKGDMAARPNDPSGLTFLAIRIDGRYSKADFVKRRAGDLKYGRRLAAEIKRLKPDLIISANTPTEAQELIVSAARAEGAPFVYWCQDFYSIAASRILARKLPGVGHLVGAYYRFLERRQMKLAAHIVHITASFCAQTDRWGIGRDRITVIPNWGAIEAIPMMDRETSWAGEQGLGQGPRYVYSGTLAVKHNPALLAALARSVENKGEVVLVSTGVGRDRLAQEKEAGGLPAMRILPLQPFKRFPEVLGSADVLLAVIEREAGEYSVPSKILSYLCAGRPIVLAAPSQNLAARLLIESGAGTVVEPDDIQGFVAAARGYADDPELAMSTGNAGRAYAEKHFELKGVAGQFERVFAAGVNVTREPMGLFQTSAMSRGH